MLFKKCELIENKLSEKISDSNPLKDKLIEMETPSDNSPIYSFLSIGLLIYVWLFLFTLIYKQANGIGYAIFSVIFTTICFFFVYKKPYLTSDKKNLKITMYLMTIIIVFLSITITINDTGKISFLEAIKTILFFYEINPKSYIALSVLSSLMLGISLSYILSPYEGYKKYYSYTDKNEKKTNQIIYGQSDLSVLFIIGIFILFHTFLDLPKDSFEKNLKLFALPVFVWFPSFLTKSFQAKKYLNTFKKAQKLDNPNNEKGI